MPPLLYFFALCNLVIGSGAFVLGGILEPLSQSLGVSVAAAGQAMTAYALATAVLAPAEAAAQKEAQTISEVRESGAKVAMRERNLGFIGLLVV